MSVTRPRLLVALGTALLTAALALLVRALLAGTDGASETGTLATLVALGGLAVAAWRLRSRPAAEDVDVRDDDTGIDAPDSDDDAGDGVTYRRAGRYRLVDAAPERTDVEHPLAGQDVAELLSSAAETARTEGSADAGVEAVRPAFRGLLRDVLVTGGTDPETAERAIETGAWTGDPEAAAVLSAAVAPPRRSLRERLWAWLRPGRAVRRRLERTAGALASVAEETLPSVPGSTAPRRVRIPPPSLAELRRDVDGTLRPATGPTAGQRVPPRSEAAGGGARDARTSEPESADESGPGEEPRTDDGASDGVAERPAPGRSGGGDP